MSQVIVLAAIGTIAYIGYRMLRSFDQGQSLQAQPVRIKSIPLERGTDGIYRPAAKARTDRY